MIFYIVSIIVGAASPVMIGYLNWRDARRLGGK